MQKIGHQSHQHSNGKVAGCSAPVFCINPCRTGNGKTNNQSKAVSRPDEDLDKRIQTLLGDLSLERGSIYQTTIYPVDPY